MSTSITGEPSRVTDAGPGGPPAARTTLALASLAMGGVALGTAEFASMGVLPSVATTLGVSEPRAGLLISAYALGVVIGAPVLAVLGARVPRRSLLVALMVLFTAAQVGSALAPNFAALAVARFLSGLPHGAFLGVAALAAASLVPEERRGRAIATVILGLTVANVGGVPVATAIGQLWGWRATFALVAVLGGLTILAVRWLVPILPAGRTGRLAGELRAFRHGQLWLTMAICVVGFGGVFAVYTFIASTLTQVAGLSRGWIPVVLSLFGIGMSVGAVLGGRLADRSVLRTVVLSLVAMTAIMAGFTALVHHPATAVLGVFLLGVICMIGMPSLQARLMDAAPEAPTLAASLMHSATNTANAVGAWAGGLVLSAGAGYAAIGWVGAAMALGGLILAFVSVTWAHRSVPWQRSNPSGRDLENVYV